jgi:phenylacetate-coenzyme A ligase PaaK-like adenylate-forming protein
MLNDLLRLEPFSLDRAEKGQILTKLLLELSEIHRRNCSPYNNIMNALGVNFDSVDHYSQLPFLPTRVFKELDLVSVNSEQILKTMTSSGTSGQSVSKIYLDKETASLQGQVLTKLVSNVIGSTRLPMIILDSEATIKNRELFSARGAGILGFSMFGSKRIFGLNDRMELDIEAISSFIENHKGSRILLFGFTYIVWLHFLKELEKSGLHLNLESSILLHGGGFKKLSDEAVSKEEFKRRLHDACGISVSNIHDYYGMVEQTGSIFLECEKGYLHASNFSDIIIRRPLDFMICDVGEPGIVQVISLIPRSYPGHSLLTEDSGVLLGEDDCGCGRKGKYFSIIGRLRQAEIRGCSDTYEKTNS